MCRVVADRLAALSRELEDGGEIDAEMLEDEEERMELSTYARALLVTIRLSTFLLKTSVAQWRVRISIRRVM